MAKESIGRDLQRIWMGKNLSNASHAHTHTHTQFPVVEGGALCLLLVSVLLEQRLKERRGHKREHTVPPLTLFFCFLFFLLSFGKEIVLPRIKQCGPAVRISD